MLRKGDLARGQATSMTAVRDDAAGGGWHRLGVLILAVIVVGLPINNAIDYAALLIVVLIVTCGNVRTRPHAWLGAVGVVFFVVLGQQLLSPPRIEEGHNVFLPSAELEKAVPGDVYRQMLTEFDAQYPVARRCDPKQLGCWQSGGFPDRPFAFSADSVWRKTNASRTTTALDFDDPVWLRLGFVNDFRYNWTSGNDVTRATRDRRFWMGWHRWHLTMPWFEMIRIPADYVGGVLCWRGTVMWESENERFTRWPGEGCRAIEVGDGGRRVFGIAIIPETLAMRIDPPWTVWARQLLIGTLAFAGLAGLVITLVCIRRSWTILPLAAVGLSALVIAIDDASFLGGVRPFDGGDDGLFYDGVGRSILQQLVNGDLAGFLHGGESVFYYGGPGLRYFRAVEHIFFGESYLGYLSLVLLFPFLVYRLFRRFLPSDWSLALIFVFIAIPVGAIFGTSFVHYAQLAARGFADPAAYILFVAGMLPIIGQPGGHRNFFSAFIGALLLALAIWMKPIVAPAAAVLLSGAGVAALFLGQWPRLIGLSIGITPVFLMTLHNWVFGHEFVLFSANAQHSDVLVMPPSAYGAAAREVLNLDVHGAFLGRFGGQIANWLSGPAESFATIPLNAAGVAVLIYVVFRGRRFDPWLRLVGASALAQHAVALFYTAAVARYHFLAWFLTMVVVMVWLQQLGVVWMQRRYPALSERFIANPLCRRLASWLARLQKVSA
jgi:hypothetical protein